MDVAEAAFEGGGRGRPRFVGLGTFARSSRMAGTEATGVRGSDTEIDMVGGPQSSSPATLMTGTAGFEGASVSPGRLIIGT